MAERTVLLDATEAVIGAVALPVVRREPGQGHRARHR